jgi:hypothetical protein
MFYLQREHKFDHVARMSAPDGPLEILSKKESDEAKGAQKTGLFMVVDDHLVCLFRLDGTLWFRFDDRLIAITEAMHASWDLFEKDRQLRGRFRLRRNDETLLDFEHAAFCGRTIIPGDDTPFVTEEDYDFMLFITNVLQEPGRRQRFFSRTFVL